uniref:SJCHGC08965 protein n=1 Tax=Schistosoma japonicum TaxID=6182 RepID=Q5DAT4_SCHJA|nr:SJCHGC08965 protein [Schistosoma japonicum]
MMFYFVEQNLADKSLLYTFKDRLEEASTIEKTTMLAVSEYNLLIKRSEEKWTAREDLNKVEKKYLPQRKQNTSKELNKLSLNLRDANEKVSTQIINVKNLLMKAVKAANNHRQNEDNKEFLDEYNKSRRKLNRAFNTLVNMIEKAECRRFELCKILPFEDRIKRLVVTMDKEREICRILD